VRLEQGIKHTHPHTVISLHPLNCLNLFTQPTDRNDLQNYEFEKIPQMSSYENNHQRFSLEQISAAITNNIGNSSRLSTNSNSVSGIKQHNNCFTAATQPA